MIFRRFLSTSAVKKSVSDLKSIQGQRVLVRADLNVPLSKQDSNVITDDTRIQAVLPTIKDLSSKGAKIILCSHLGRPKGKVNDAMRLTPVSKRLSELLGKQVEKTEDCVGPEVDSKVQSLQDGDVLLLENVRFHPEEEKNDTQFAQSLAKHADIFVNDAFGTAHRAHASTEGVTKFVDESVAGFLMEKELKYLNGALANPKRPLAAIIGGAKVSTKFPVLHALIEKCDKIFIGGGMIFTFYKAQGLSIGASMCEEDQLEAARELLKKAKANGVEIVLPTDVVVADRFEADAEAKEVDVNSIPEGWLGLDIGSKSQAHFKELLSDCQTVVWNGPMGVFEFEKFAAGTTTVASTLAELTQKGATTIVGGGDSVAAVKKQGLEGFMSHVSTGGGASLELLEGKHLPGVVALSDQ